MTGDGARPAPNAFLGGALCIHQPRNGYRAGVNPVLLAASIPAKGGQSLLDLGCGVGVAGLCVARRVAGVRLTGLEIQPEYAALARRNADENRIAMEVITGDLTQMPAALRQVQFDHVIANPPYFDRSATQSAQDQGRELSRGATASIESWVRSAAKRTAPGGCVTFIHRTERLPELLAAFGACLGRVQVLPLAARVGRPPQLCLIRGRKGRQADFRLYAPWILHEGAAHDGDRDTYTDATAGVLRAGQALPFPD